MRAILVFTLFTLIGCGPSTTLVVPANGKIDIDYPDYTRYNIELKNKSGEEIEVRVKSKQTGEFVSGFGLAPKGEATVSVNDRGELELNNPSDKAVKVALTPVEQSDITRSIDPSSSISFTLSNTSAKSIPLIIPGVMNPNLSPSSTSGVDLAVGQEIFFKVKNRKYLLLKVSDAIEDGDTIDVAELIKTRKAELGLK